MGGEQWFYDGQTLYAFCKSLSGRGATWWRGLDRDMWVVRWIEYWQW